jgi:hypothetical protein
MKSCFLKFPFDKGARERCQAERYAEPWTLVPNPTGVATPEAVQAAWEARMKELADEEAKKNGTYVDPNIDVNEVANALIRKGEKDKKRKYLITVGVGIAVVSTIAFFIIRKINK